MILVVRKSDWAAASRVAVEVAVTSRDCLLLTFAHPYVVVGNEALDLKACEIVSNT
jgi:hypothetical protein